MIQVVTIQEIHDVRRGVSAVSGVPWQMQDILVSWPEEIDRGFVVTNKQIFTLHGAEVDRFARLNMTVGMMMDADLSFGLRQYNGKWYSSNKLFIK